MLKELEEERDRATATAKEKFPSTSTVDTLRVLAVKAKLEPVTNGNKDEIIESYCVQYVFRKLISKRQDFMRTKERHEAFKVYLPWYRVLLASFRRLRFGVLRKVNDDDDEG